MQFGGATFAIALPPLATSIKDAAGLYDSHMFNSLPPPRAIELPTRPCRWCFRAETDCCALFVCPHACVLAPFCSYYPVHFMIATLLILGFVALVVPTPPSDRFGIESRGRLPLSEVVWKMLQATAPELQPVYNAVADDDDDEEEEEEDVKKPVLVREGDGQPGN